MKVARYANLYLAVGIVVTGFVGNYTHATNSRLSSQDNPSHVNSIGTDEQQLQGPFQFECENPIDEEVARNSLDRLATLET